MVHLSICFLLAILFFSSFSLFISSSCLSTLFNNLTCAATSEGSRRAVCGHLLILESAVIVSCTVLAVRGPVVRAVAIPVLVELLPQLALHQNLQWSCACRQVLAGCAVDTVVSPASTCADSWSSESFLNMSTEAKS